MIWRPLFDKKKTIGRNNPEKENLCPTYVSCRLEKKCPSSTEILALHNFAANERRVTSASWLFLAIVTENARNIRMLAVWEQPLRLRITQKKKQKKREHYSDSLPRLFERISSPGMIKAGLIGCSISIRSKDVTGSWLPAKPLRGQRGRGARARAWPRW